MIQLNDFSRLMLFWNRIHPYQAVEMIQVRRPVDLEGLRLAAQDELAATGIAGPVVDEATGVCSFTSASYPVETTLVTPQDGESPRRCLERRCSEELNRPFRVNEDALIRFWVIPDSGAPWVGITWQHWFCDGMTAGDLLRRILARWLRLPSGDDRGLTDCHALTSEAAFPMAFRLRQRIASGIEIARALLLSRRMHVPERSASDFRVAVRFMDWPHDVLARLKACAARTGVTVNDVLVAAFLQALDRTLPRRGWRQRLSIGNAINLRPQGGVFLVDKMGNYLALMIVQGPARLPQRFDELLQHVQQQTERTKRQQTYWAGLGGMRLTRAALPWLPERLRVKAAMDVLRVTAGISNLRYPSTWYGSEWDGAVGEYWRGIPLGLSTPLALGLTTKGDRMTASATWHPAAFAEARIDAIVNELQGVIKSI